MSTDILNVTDSTFEDEVLRSEQPIVLDFWAEWCGPCKNIAPILNELANEYKQSVYPMILVADPVLKNSLEYIKINPTNMTPVKHYGYSAQWFLMFFVLCLMYIFYGFKRNEK